MNPENQEALFALAPEWFQRDDIRQSLMAFGFEVGDGWFTLLNKLILNLKQLDLPEDFKVLQVKEKFGGLRFYISGGNDAIYALIDDAGEQSYKICENCGEAGAPNGPSNKDEDYGGWITTLCDTCRRTRYEGDGN